MNAQMIFWLRNSPRLPARKIAVARLAEPGEELVELGEPPLHGVGDLGQVGEQAVELGGCCWSGRR